MGFLRSFIFFFLCAALAIFCIKQWMATKSYVFNAEIISRLTKKHLKHGGSPQEIFRHIAADLGSSYPEHILPEKDQLWMFVYAGGWKASMCIVHASLTEYVLFFGTAVDTMGHSGRYWANISDTIISGQFTQWKEGRFDSQVYKSGDDIIHLWGEVTVVSWTGGTWMVEYGRGFLPTALGFTLSDAVFSTQDFAHVAKVIVVYLKALWQEFSLDCLEFSSYIRSLTEKH